MARQGQVAFVGQRALVKLDQAAAVGTCFHDFNARR